MRHLNRYLFLTSLVFTALTAEAAQLGSAKGAAVFGRPLDLTVQVRLDAPADDAANCFSVEVFQADNKFDAGRVRLDVTPAANGLDATVRVRSSTAVNEPWAKVILRSNCGAKVSRQYDFLTDFATDIPTSNMLAEASPSQPLASTVNVANTALNSNDIVQAPISNWNVKRPQTKAKQTLQKADALITQAAISPKKTKPAALSKTVAPVTTKQTTTMVTDAAGQSRLKMETFELTDEHQVLLKLSNALVAPTGMRTPEEIQALAQATAVWRAVNGMPSEAKAVEPVSTQVAATTQAPAVQASPVTIPTMVNQKLAGKSEFSNLMVYGLIGLLALTLACIAWLWLRVRKASRAGYGWLNDPLDDEVAEHEQTQFLHSNFHVDKAKTKDQEAVKELVEPSFDVTTKADAVLEPISMETGMGSSSDEEIFVEVAEDVKPLVAALPVTSPKEKSVVKTTPQTPIVSALPPHFDDPRFEERVIRNKKKSRDIVHEEPIASTEKLMELVLADTPPKLRSVSTPALDLIDKPNKDTLPKSAATTIKDDAKGNLIDFDVFAEPEPLNKPTRFIR